MDSEAARAQEEGFFSELNTRTTRHHPEGGSGQVMSSTKESLTVKTIKQISCKREVEPGEEKEKVLKAV